MPLPADGLYNGSHDVPLSSIELLNQHGHMPLPPYIDRPDEGADQERYQTVYAREPGAVAAPTAGLHFDQPMLEHLQAMGVETGFVTLHVGAGTFQPVRVERVEDHPMHSERFRVEPTLVEQVAATRARGGRVQSSKSVFKGQTPFMAMARDVHCSHT